MNIEDALLVDKHGIMGSEAKPFDFTGWTDYIRECQRTLRDDLFRLCKERSTGNNSNVTPVQYEDRISQVRSWWHDGFPRNNHNSSSLFPMNLNDMLAHVYIQMCYLHYHRQIDKIFAFERKWLSQSGGLYDFRLVAEACCAIAALAGCRHIHVMQDPELQQLSPIEKQMAVPLTLGQLELNKQLLEFDQEAERKFQGEKASVLDNAPASTFPSLQDLNAMACDFHLGFINTWYFYRFHRDDRTMSHEWEIKERLIEHVRILQTKYLMEVQERRERSRLLSLSSSSSSSNDEKKDREEKKEGGDDGDDDDEYIPREWLPLSDRWQRERAKHTYMMRNEQPQNSGCYYWFRTPLSYMDRFLPLQSHVFQHALAEHELFDKYPNRVFNRWQESYKTSHRLFIQWTHGLANSSSENEDGIVKTFKMCTFEHLLPLGARSLVYRLKDGYKAADIAFREVLGDRAVIYIDSIVSNYQSRAHIARTTTHPFFPYMALTLMHFSVKQQGHALADFMDSCVVLASHILDEEFSANNPFDVERQRGRTRVPLMICLTGKYLVHSYFDQDSDEIKDVEKGMDTPLFGDGIGIGTGYWYVCSNAIEWVLTWLVLCYMQYPKSMKFPIGKSFAYWLSIFRLKKRR